MAEDFNPTTDSSAYPCSCGHCDGDGVNLTPLKDDLIAISTAAPDGHFLSRETALELAANLIAWATDNKDPCTVFSPSDNDGELEQLSTPLPYKRALAFSTGTFPEKIKKVFAEVARYKPGSTK